MPDSSSSAGTTEVFQDVVRQLVETHHAVAGKMFGMPSVNIGGKACAGLYQEAMVFKLGGEAHASALALQGAHLFDPSGMGRAMKEWVVVPVAHSARWPELGRHALDYVTPKR